MLESVTDVPFTLSTSQTYPWPVLTCPRCHHHRPQVVEEINPAPVTVCKKGWRIKLKIYYRAERMGCPGCGYCFDAVITHRVLRIPKDPAPVPLPIDWL